MPLFQEVLLEQMKEETESNLANPASSGRWSVNEGFVKICYFIVVLRTTQQYLHSLPANAQYEMEEKSIWTRSVGQCPT